MTTEAVPSVNRFRWKRPTKHAYRVCRRCGGPGARCSDPHGGFVHLYCMDAKEKRARK